MIQIFSEDLSRQEIYAHGAELAQMLGFDKDETGNRVYSWPKEKKVLVHVFEDPVLATDDYRIGQIEPCTKRYTVNALFQSDLKITEYKNVSLEFEQGKYPGVWGPSIDTLLFCRAMNNIDLSSFRNAVEVGSGSGFLSKYVLKNADNLENITLVDLNEYSARCASRNFDNKGVIDTRTEFITGNAIEYLEENPGHDLVICNPPYIPRPKSIDDNPYEGVDLLVYLIKNAKNYLNPGGSLITNISSLCADIAQKGFAEAGSRFNHLDKMEVPLKVLNVLNNKEWMRYLRRKGLRKETRQGHDYWQTINIVEVKP